MSSDAVRLEIEDGVATITLNEPDSMNALSSAIVSGVADALDEAEADGDVRCLVLQGAGPAFCAGGDISGMGAGSDRSQHDDVRRIVGLCEELPIRIFNFGVPTVAKVDGYCVGAGMGLALACDAVLASERSTFGLVFRNIGLSVDLTTSYLVPRLIGPQKAKEITLTGELIEGPRAEEMGLVNHAYPDDEFEARADEFVETIAEGPTVALSYSMQNIDRGLDGGIREAAERESDAQAIAKATADHLEGVEAFSEDRDPDFEGQ